MGTRIKISGKPGQQIAIGNVVGGDLIQTGAQPVPDDDDEGDEA